MGNTLSEVYQDNQDYFLKAALCLKTETITAGSSKKQQLMG